MVPLVKFISKSPLCKKVVVEKCVDYEGNYLWLSTNIFIILSLACYSIFS